MEDKINVELPLTCSDCHALNMVDLENLHSRPLDRVIWIEEYQCENCGSWELVFYNTISLEEKIAQAGKSLKAFGKAMRKAENLQKRARKERDGPRKHDNEVSFRSLV